MLYQTKTELRASIVNMYAAVSFRKHADDITTVPLGFGMAMLLSNSNVVKDARFFNTSPPKIRENARLLIY